MGALVEDAACRYLALLGYRIFERNYTCRLGKSTLWRRRAMSLCSSRSGSGNGDRRVARRGFEQAEDGSTETGDPALPVGTAG